MKEDEKTHVITLTDEQHEKIHEDLIDAEDHLGDAEQKINSIRRLLEKTTITSMKVGDLAENEDTYEERVIDFRLTVNDWQMFSTMEGVAAVAADLNRTFKAAYGGVANIGTLEERTKQAYVVQRIMYNAMNAYDKFGARDTEPECTLCSALEILFNVPEIHR